MYKFYKLMKMIIEDDCDKCHASMWDNMLPAGGKETSSYNIILQRYLTRNNCSYIMRTKVQELLFLSYNKGGEKSRGEIRNSTEFSQEADMRSRK